MILADALVDVGRNFGRVFLTTEPAPVRNIDAEREAREMGEHVWATKLAALPFADDIAEPPTYGPLSARHERTRCAVERLLDITR